MDILNQLKSEVDDLRYHVSDGSYDQEESEYATARTHEFKRFEWIKYRGDDDIVLATQDRSKLFLAQNMTEYPLAWLDGVAAMERKLEHAVNNLELMAKAPGKPNYDVKSVFDHVLC